MKALAFGEVLWDVFPNGKRIGGAPLNFAGHLAKHGHASYILSLVGEDEYGKELLSYAKQHKLQTDYIFMDKEHPTGRCVVACDDMGEPVYNLIENVAYDFISLTEDEISSLNDKEFDVLYFGTLAQRNEVSEDTFRKIVESVKFKECFCDLNLRQSFYKKSQIEFCLHSATIVKLNRDECNAVVKLGLAPDIKENEEGYRSFCADLCSNYNINTVILTMDKDGAFGFDAGSDLWVMVSGAKRKVVSAVGAGDSFSACFLHNFLKGETLGESIRRANILGGYVVGFEEALPEYTNELLELIL